MSEEGNIAADNETRVVLDCERSLISTSPRLIPYWLTIVTFAFSITIIHTYNSDKAYDAIQAQLIDLVRS
jgi:hypothetical protein